MDGLKEMGKIGQLLRTMWCLESSNTQFFDVRNSCILTRYPRPVQKGIGREPCYHKPASDSPTECSKNVHLTEPMMVGSGRDCKGQMPVLGLCFSIFCFRNMAHADHRSHSLTANRSNTLPDHHHGLFHQSKMIQAYMFHSFSIFLNGGRSHLIGHLFSIILLALHIISFAVPRSPPKTAARLSTRHL